LPCRVQVWAVADAAKSSAIAIATAAHALVRQMLMSSPRLIRIFVLISRTCTVLGSSGAETGCTPAPPFYRDSQSRALASARACSLIPCEHGRLAPQQLAVIDADNVVEAKA